MMPYLPQLAPVAVSMSASVSFCRFFSFFRFSFFSFFRFSFFSDRFQKIESEITNNQIQTANVL